MIVALLLAAAAPQGAIDAERAFAADAKAIGQWAAFRKWAADDAVMFVPQATEAHVFLKPLKEPAEAVDWWPTAGFVSCNGEVAANTGGSLWPGGRPGYFSTIWRRKGGAWRWLVDHGDDLATPRPRTAEPAVRRAACTGARPAIVTPPPGPGVRQRFAASSDRTMLWQWTVQPDGARSLVVSLWNGAGYDVFIDDRVAAPAATAR